MDINVNSCRRTLAIYPSRRHFAYVVVEERGLIVDWALVRLYSRQTDEFLTRIEPLLLRYVPASIILPGDLSPRRAEHSRGLVASAETYAQSRGYVTLLVTGSDVRRESAHRTRHARALAVADSFPELRPFLPEKRRPGHAEPEMMSVFEAAYLVMAAAMRTSCPEMMEP